MVSSVNKVEGEAKQCRALITHHLTETIKTVTKHSGEIKELKEDLVKTKDDLGGLKSRQEDLTSKMTWIQEKVIKAHEITCYSRQHLSKGTYPQIQPPGKPFPHTYLQLVPQVPHLHDIS